MNRLERFRGHFFNWYDTQDLRPLEPKYVSSVDSGNLAGHLIVLRSACREMIAAPVIGPEPLAGIADAVKLAQNSLDALRSGGRISELAHKRLQIALASLTTSLELPVESPADFVARLSNLKQQADELSELVRALDRDGRQWTLRPERM